MSIFEIRGGSLTPKTNNKKKEGGKGREGKGREGAAFNAWPGVTCIPEAL